VAQKHRTVIEISSDDDGDDGETTPAAKAKGSTGYRAKSEEDPEDDGGRGALGVEDSIMDESGEEEDEVGGMLDGDEDDD